MLLKQKASWKKRLFVAMILPVLQWRFADAAFKRANKVGHIGKPDIKGDLADAERCVKQRVARFAQTQGV